MTALPQIKLSRDYHDGKDIIKIEFAFNRALIERVKQLSGARWSFSKRYWYVPSQDFRLSDLFMAVRGAAFIDYSLLRKNQFVKPFPETVVRKDPRPNVLLPKGYLELLKQKRYSESTIKTYTHYFKDFQRYFFEQDLENIQREEINAYILELIEKRDISSSQQNQRISAIKFYYEKVLGKEKEEYHIERPRKAKKLPDVLSKDEIKRMLEFSDNIKHKALIALIYSCGLRRSEVINLRLTDIDSERNVVKIVGAKGKKDRYVQLSPALLNLLRDYYREFKPASWMFEGQFGGQYRPESIVKVIKRAAARAGIFKRVYPHMLRHSYATHQLEQGIDIRFIQQWLGHENVQTTQVYTHVSEQNFANFKNPLDDMLK